MSTHTALRRRVSLPALLLLLVFAAGSQSLMAQVEVAPTRVILSMRERAREVKVINPTETPMEIEASLDFQLIRSDSLGAITLDSAQNPQERARSCHGWLKVFPRRFVLLPHASRSIRVLVQPPDSIGDGEYWGRLVVGSVPIDHDLAAGGDTTEGISTSLTMKLELSLPVIYRKGVAETGIEIKSANVKRVDADLLALFDLARRGNSAWRGTIFVNLRSSDGMLIEKFEQQLTAEFAVRNAVHLPALKDGNYTMQVELQSIKKGSANDAVIPTEPVMKYYRLAVAGNITRLSPME
jgi:P pilus assembly chaperone PapD